MALVGDLVVNMGVNRRGFDSGLAGARSSMSSFVGRLTRIAAPIAGLLGGALAGRAAINEARAAEQASRKLEAVLKATGGAAGLTADEIKKLAGDLQSVTNFGDDATISAAAVLATFKEIKGDVFRDALRSAQDLSAVMEQDLQSSIVQIGKALNDPIKGVTALQRVGVSFTQQQKDQIKAMQKSGNMLGAQGIILRELQSEFGGSAKAMADPLTQAKNVLGDVAETIGFVLLPPLRELMNAFIGGVGPITSNADAFKALGESIAAVVRDGLQPLVSGMATAANFVVDAVDMISLSIRNAGDIFRLVGIDMNLALFDLVPGVEHVAEIIGSTLVALWDATGAAFSAFVTNVKGGFTEIKNVAGALVTGIKSAFDALLSGDNPLEAFASAFTETLASQSDAISGGNPLEVFADQFKKTQQAALQGFRKGPGLGDALREEREKILAGIGSRESARSGLTAPTLGVLGAPGDEDGASKTQNKIAAGSERGSKEALEHILKAGARGKDPTLKVAEKQLAEQKLATAALQALASNPPACVVGDI